MPSENEHPIGDEITTGPAVTEPDVDPEDGEDDGDADEGEDGDED